MNYLVPHTPKNKIQKTKKGMLSNMTFLCKDMCDIKGFKTSCGNPDFYKNSSKAKKNALFLNKILSEGALLEGITICDEFFYSIIGENIHYGTPENKNALGCVPGGSSSGSAAALTQKEYDFTIGTDTGGSVRVPASFCGIYGIRPTHGRINLQGVYPMSQSFDTLGWFSKTKANMLKLGKLFFNNFKNLKINPKNMYIADDLVDLLNNDLKNQFINYCDSEHGTLSKLKISSYNKDKLSDCFRIIQGFEIKKNILPWILKYKPLISSEVNSRFEIVKTISRNSYEESIDLRNEFLKEIDKNLPIDVILLFPTTPLSAPKKGMSETELADFRKKIMMFTSIGGLSSRPQISIPKFKGDTGPIGLSILGYKNCDEVLLENLQIF